MSIESSLHKVPVAPEIGRLQRLRLPLLVLLCLWLLGMIICLRVIAPSFFGSVQFFLPLYLCTYLPSLLACLLIWHTRRSGGRLGWLELGLVMLGALLCRILVLPVPPNLSGDSLRYLWDARVTLHGFSPYVYIPKDPILIPLRDNAIYPHIGFHDVPTLYPPVAQGFYLLSYLLAPSNVFVLKGFLIGFDMGSCLLLALLLSRRGRDPLLCCLYAWSPLPIIEFGMQGHIDALVLLQMLLLVICAQSQRRGMRVLSGFLLGLATLTKLYPIIVLVVIWRRRDYLLLVTLGLTILAGYLPFLILGHGQVFGLFSTYLNEYGLNGGIVPVALHWLKGLLPAPAWLFNALERVLDVGLLGGAMFIVYRRRQREQMSMEAGILLLIVVLFSISSHIYPWYTPVLLPWVVLLWPGQQRWHQPLLLAMWYFPSITILGYYYTFARDWSLYYLVVYAVPLLFLAVALYQKKNASLDVSNGEAR